MYDLSVAEAAPGITSRQEEMVLMTLSLLIKKSKAFNLPVERFNKQVENGEEREGGRERERGEAREGGRKEERRKE